MSHYKPIAPKKYDRRKHIISFKNAINGIRLAYQTQPNFRIHTALFFLALFLAFIFKIEAWEYIAIIMISSLVFAMEMLNTAAEAIGDEIANGKYNKLVGVAKDVSAGGVLITALAAFIIGVVVFAPRIIAFL